MTIRRVNYKFTLEHDDLGDVVIPMSSFTARIREGDPSYLQVVVPNYDLYADDILDRAQHCHDCSLLITKIRDGSEEYDVLRVTFENLRLDIGSTSQTVFLTGHRTFYNPDPQTVTLTDVDYVRTGYDEEQGTDHRIRFSAYLNVSAGDTVNYTVNGDSYSFQVQLLTMNASQWDFEQEASSE